MGKMIKGSLGIFMNLLAAKICAEEKLAICVLRVE